MYFDIGSCCIMFMYSVLSHSSIIHKKGDKGDPKNYRCIAVSINLLVFSSGFIALLPSRQTVC